MKKIHKFRYLYNSKYVIISQKRIENRENNLKICKNLNILRFCILKSTSKTYKIIM